MPVVADSQTQSSAAQFRTACLAVAASSRTRDFRLCSAVSLFSRPSFPPVFLSLDHQLMRPSASTRPSPAAPAAKQAASPAAAAKFTKLTPEQHVLSIVRSADRKHYMPLDIHVRQYFFENKEFLKQPKLRKEISTKVYHLVTWRGMLDYLIDPTGLKYVSWDDRLEKFKGLDVKAKFADESLPLHARCSMPKTLIEHLKKSYSTEQILDIARGSNFGAPLTVRANPLKTTREQLVRLLQDKYRYRVEPCERSELGVRFVKKPSEPIQAMPEFKDGLFEIQDEASQVAAAMVKAEPGDQVLDFCAGAGGKSLAFGPRLKGKGVLHLHDLPQFLKDAKKRLARAGITNAKFYALKEPQEGEIPADAAKESQAAEEVYDDLGELSGRMDWVLADVPCSGTGVYRRNPDMRWRFSEEGLARLTTLQLQLARAATHFLKPKTGRLVYATCSLLQEENEAQVDRLMKECSLELAQEPFKSIPTSPTGMDGFFAAVLRQKK